MCIRDSSVPGPCAIATVGASTNTPRAFVSHRAGFFRLDMKPESVVMFVFLAGFHTTSLDIGLIVTDWRTPRKIRGDRGRQGSITTRPGLRETPSAATDCAPAGEAKRCGARSRPVGSSFGRITRWNVDGLATTSGKPPLHNAHRWSLDRLGSPHGHGGSAPVSYTHLTLPTNREV